MVNWASHDHMVLIVKGFMMKMMTDGIKKSTWLLRSGHNALF